MFMFCPFWYNTSLFPLSVPPLSSFLPLLALTRLESPDFHIHLQLQLQLQLQLFFFSLLFFSSPFYLLTQKYTSRSLYYQVYCIDISTCSKTNG